MRYKSYLILGGGPAGLTMARMLKDRGVTDVKVLEASPKVGGKCLSSPIGDHIVEFGTCYAIWSHKYVLKHMKKLGIKRNYLRAQRIDGRELLDYIKDGSGPPFVFQAIKYALKRRSLMKRAQKGDPSVNEILAQPTREWLRANNLGKIENMMHRVVTSIGYGYLDRLPLLHAMRWVDFDMLLTGLLKFTVMPEGGWQHFWNEFAKPLDVHLQTKVVAVDRSGETIRVTTESGETFEADQLINTIPISDFCALTDPTAAEQELANSIQWSGYTTTLLSVEDWPHDAPVNAWSATCATDENDGQLLYYRYECPEEDGRVLFSVGQLSIAYTPDELAELATFDAREKGAIDPRVVQQVIWQYMPTYDASKIREGLLQKMVQMQGEMRTFHTGSSFSHEAVSTIAAFNARLLPSVAP
ncbi:MAG: FAD-dependent oxidoreductase [Henriciella sp.]|nr:FAD-dependent oxidoreductase [Henriciella sp.]